MKEVCVFLSAQELGETYTKPAEELGKLLAENGYGFVYGGSDMGLMKVMSSSVQNAGGVVIGITVEMFKDSRKLDAHEMIVARDLAERKRIMNERSQAFVIMAGGLGTLDEATELLALKQLGLHNKPLIFLNTNNFYDGLKTQLTKMQTEGFLSKNLTDIAFFAEQPSDVITLLMQEVTEN